MLMKSSINVLLLAVCLAFVLSCSLGGDTNSESTTSGGGATEANENSNNDFAVESDDSGVKPDADSPGNKSVAVRFEKGKTSRGYDETVSSGGNHVYTLGASKGQLMNVRISSDNDAAVFNVLDPVGNKLNDSDSGSMVFTKNLPANGNYKIIVTGSKGNSKYKINFSVNKKAADEEDEEAVDEDDEDEVPAAGLTKTVKFSKGGSSATYSDAVIRGEQNTYILGASAGQTMNVSISSLENNAVFQIKGPNGYLPGTAPGKDARSWSGTLPANGKYNIIVGGTRGNATYKVSFSIK